MEKKKAIMRLNTGAFAPTWLPHTPSFRLPQALRLSGYYTPTPAKPRYASPRHTSASYRRGCLPQASQALWRPATHRCIVPTLLPTPSFAGVMAPADRQARDTQVQRTAMAAYPKVSRRSRRLLCQAAVRSGVMPPQNSILPSLTGWRQRLPPGLGLFHLALHRPPDVRQLLPHRLGLVAAPER